MCSFLLSCKPFFVHTVLTKYTIDIMAPIVLHALRDRQRRQTIALLALFATLFACMLQVKSFNSAASMTTGNAFHAPRSVKSTFAAAGTDKLPRHGYHRY